MNIEKIKLLRKELHKHPELSGKEKETKSILLQFISAHMPDSIVENLGEHGFALVYEPKEKAERTIMFRADMDALPIQEINNFEHCSVNEGVGHKCGHDGHMAALAGVSELLSAKRPERTRVVLLFQPAEEIGEGAKSVIESEGYEKIKPDFAFGLHNLPGFKKEDAIITHGTFSAASTGIIIKLTGKTSHAAEPENGISPIPAVVSLVEYLNNLDDYVSVNNFFLNTIIHINAGEPAFGTSPGYAEIMCTLRSFDNADFNLLKTEIALQAKQTASANQLRCEVEFVEEFAANVNDPVALEISTNAIKETGLNIYKKDTPFRWSEDFGYFSLNAKTSFIGIGAGEDVPDLHNNDYDFPDDLLNTAINYFMNVVKQFEEMSK